jgi:hypothetical protein
LLKKLPLFPLIPIAPAGLLLGSFVTALRALRRVKRLEHRVDTAEALAAG